MSQEEKISELGLMELKKYACPKNQHMKEWYLECLNCNGISGCPAGQRAWVILNEQTQPDEKLPEHAKTRQSMEEMKEAIASGEPMKYLMDRGASYKNARQRVWGWRKRFPEYFKDVPKEHKPGIHKGGVNKDELPEYHVRQREKAMDDCKRALASGDPHKWLMDKYGISKKQAGGRIYNWKISYPELFKPYAEKPKYLQSVPGVKEEKPEVNMDEDEISMEQFLQELGGNDSEDTVQPEEAADLSTGPEETVEDTAGVEKEEPEKLSESDTRHTGDVLSELEKKYKLLTVKRAGIECEINKLKEELQWIEEQRCALDIVRKMFHQNTETKRSLTAV